MPDLVEFERFVVEVQGRLRAYVAGIGVGPDAVDEVAQEAFVALWLHGDGRPSDVPAWSWLKGIARHKALHHLRSRSLRSARLVELLAGDAADPVEDDDELGALRDCLARLGAQARRLVDLTYGQGRSSDDIAATTGLTGSAIRKQLLRLRAVLAECVRGRLHGGRT